MRNANRGGGGGRDREGGGEGRPGSAFKKVQRMFVLAAQKKSEPKLTVKAAAMQQGRRSPLWTEGTGRRGRRAACSLSVAQSSEIIKIPCS